MNALYRPGPMAYIPSFINRKMVKNLLKFSNGKTVEGDYGITVYQRTGHTEAIDLANFTWRIDELRKAMGKKLQKDGH